MADICGDLPMCGPLVDGVTDVVNQGVGAVAGSAFDAFVQAMVDGANWTVQKLMTLWLSAPSPDVAGPGSVAVWLSQRLSLLVAATVVGTLIVAGARLAIYGRSADARGTMEALVRTLVIGSIGGTIVATGIQLTDALSDALLGGVKLDLGKNIFATTGATIAPGALWLLALIVVLSQVIQLAFMAARSAMLVVLVGTLTWAAAASGTKTGRQWLERSSGWILAFLLYKPAAALIYAVAFKLTSSKDLYGQLSGIFMMVLAVFALPALMRLFVPMTAALGSANAGALAGATVGAAIATGAMVPGMVAGMGAGGAGAGAGALATRQSGGGGAGGGGLGGGGSAGPSGSGSEGHTSLGAASSGIGSDVTVGGSAPSGADLSGASSEPAGAGASPSFDGGSAGGGGASAPSGAGAHRARPAVDPTGPARSAAAAVQRESESTTGTAPGVPPTETAS